MRPGVRAGLRPEYGLEKNGIMQTTHDGLVESQFGPQARAYVDSAVHAKGADLDALEEIVRQIRPARALDLGAGGGHVSYKLALHAGCVTAADLSPEMLAALAETAKNKGLANIETVRTTAENLPFGDASFDFLGCRFSAHHWRDVDAGLRQARRVLKSGSRAVFIDVCSPGAPALDTHLQTIEILRDPSHVRDYSMAEWVSSLARAGFMPESCRTWRLAIDFPSWIARMRTPEDHVRAIRSLQRMAAQETKTYFAIEADGSFQFDVLMADCRAV